MARTYIMGVLVLLGLLLIADSQAQEATPTATATVTPTPTPTPTVTVMPTPTPTGCYRALLPSLAGMELGGVELFIRWELGGGATGYIHYRIVDSATGSEIGGLRYCALQVAQEDLATLPATTRTALKSWALGLIRANEGVE